MNMHVGMTARLDERCDAIDKMVKAAEVYKAAIKRDPAELRQSTVYAYLALAEAAVDVFEDGNLYARQGCCEVLLTDQRDFDRFGIEIAAEFV